jgi:hypothetical protein
VRFTTRGPDVLVGKTQNPVASTGNTALITADKNRGHYGFKSGPRQNVTLPIPSGPGFPPIPSRNDGVVRKHSLQVRVARYERTGGTNLAFTQDVFVHSPSNRLRVAIYGVFEALDTSADPIFGATVPQWSIRAMSKNPKTGRETPLQIAYPAAGGTLPLPDAYEFDSAVTLLRVRLNLAQDNFDDTWTTGTIYAAVVVTWEPNTPIADAELTELYNACHLTPGISGEILISRPSPGP